MTVQLPAKIEALPMSLIDIAEALGLKVALAMMQNFGGTELRFPVNPGVDHPIIKALGETDGYALCHYMSGGKIYVPHGKVGNRRRAVADLSGRGHNRGEIARMLGLSSRQVRRLGNGVPGGDDRQGALFPEE
jgi:Mor family transcriptional regulator